MESSAKLLVYQSSEEEEAIGNQIMEDGSRRRPNLNQFLEQFEEGMRTFDHSYGGSKV